MSVAYRGKAFALNATAGKTTDVPVPAAAVPGDRLFVVAGTIGGYAEADIPAGWNNVGQFAPTTNLLTVVCTRTCQSGDSGATFRWSWSSSGRNFGYCLAYSGVSLAVPTAAQPVLAQDVDWPIDSAAIGLAAGDWLVTAAIGRERPGTDTAKEWTNADSADVERFDLYTANAAPAIKLSAALWDSGRPLPAASTRRTVTPAPPLPLIHIWSIRVAAAAAGPPPATNPWSHMGMPQR